MDEFVEFLANLRKEKGLTVLQIAKASGLSHAIVTKYLTGERLVPEKRKDRFRDAICQTAGEQEKFDERWARSASERKGGPAVVLVDAGLSALRVSSLDFWPVAGPMDTSSSPEKEGFTDAFMRSVLTSARITMKKYNGPHDESNRPRKFDMAERLQWIETGKTQALFNLITPYRMKGLSSIPLPIRLTINGLIWANSEPELHRVRDLLVDGAVDSTSNKFQVIAVRHEVAQVHLETKGVRLGDMILLDTLDPGALAGEMKKREGQTVILAVDELTAMKVMRILNTAKKEDGSKEGGLKGAGEMEVLLVLPPNTEESVLFSKERRATPAYFFGVGFKRDNGQLITFVQSVVRSQLGQELENLAASIENLYRDLTAEIRRCLEHTVIYVGGLRRTKKGLSDPPPEGVSAEELERHRSVFVEWNARAVARRSLCLSRRSLANLPRELDSWSGILTRAAQRIDMRECIDRDWVRSMILSCAAMALGRDPLEIPADPIGLLRDLEPFSQADADRLEGITPRSVEKKKDDEQSVHHWDDFVLLLGRSLDMDLSGVLNKKGDEWEGRHFEVSSRLGQLISLIQDRLEATGDAQIVPTIRDFNEENDGEALEHLLGHYAHERSGTERGSKAVGAWRHAKEKGALAERQPRAEEEWRPMVAYNLGQLVGMIEGELTPLEKTPKDIRNAVALTLARIKTESTQNAYSKKAAGSKMLKVKFMFVTRRRADVSRKLVKRMIEAANSRDKIRGVWLERKDWDEEDQRKFKQFGFSPLGDDCLWFELKRGFPEERVPDDALEKKKINGADASDLGPDGEVAERPIGRSVAEEIGEDANKGEV